MSAPQTSPRWRWIPEEKAHTRLGRHISLIHATHDPLGLSLTQATQYNRYRHCVPTETQRELMALGYSNALPDTSFMTFNSLLVAPLCASYRDYFQTVIM